MGMARSTYGGGAYRVLVTKSEEKRQTWKTQAYISG